MENKYVKNAGGGKKILQFFRSLYDYTDECIAVLDTDSGIRYTSPSFRKAVYGDARFSEGNKIELYNLKSEPLKLSAVLQSLNKRSMWKEKVILGDGCIFLNAELKITSPENLPFNEKLLVGVFNFQSGESSMSEDEEKYKLFKLLNDTIINSNRSNDIYASIQYTIDRVCEYTKWEIGHCFLVISDDLYSTNIWNSDFNPADKVFREFSERINFKTKESMASVCIKKRVHFCRKLNDADTSKYKRILLLRKLGYKTGYWYPLKLKDEITGVLEFFSKNNSLIKTEIFEGINHISYELGSMIQRIRASEAAKINDKIAAIGRVSAAIAHEIRNPLTNISSLSQLLLEENLSDESREHLNIIIENTNIANNIITGMLNFVSPGEAHFEKCNFRSFIISLADMAELRCRGTKIKFIQKIADSFPVVYCDKVRLESALFNIIFNAVDSIKGKGIVTLDAHPSREKDFINIIIKDSGSGIIPGNLDKIFDPFFSTKDTGTGLGLTLSLQTISAHGGTLNIKSRPGFGTVAEIRLPAERKA